MLRKLAVALAAASVFSAPVLAQTGSTGTQAPASKPAVAAPATPSKTVAPTDQAKQTDSVKQTKKKSRHIGKQVRHGVRGKVANSHSAKIAVAHKGGAIGVGTVR
jgi:hypothetical protein